MDKPQESVSKNSSGVSRAGFRAPAFLNGLFNFLVEFLISSQDVIGIDIGSSYIKILQLHKKSKKYVVRKCITRALPQVAKDNNAEKRKLAQEFVKEFIAETRSKSTLGRFVISGKGVFIFSLSVPYLNKKDLRGAVGIELKKRLPFQLDINNVVFDYFVTGQFRDEKSSGLQITCIAADRQAIDEQVQLLKDMNIRPVAINTIPDCLGNLLPYCFDNLSNKKTTTLLDIGANISLLNFYKGRTLVFSREIPIGGEHITHAMAKPINSPNGPMNISLEEAEKLKRNIGIPLQDEANVEFLTDFGPLKGDQLSGLLRPTLERMVMEINRTIVYYIKTFKSENLIDEIYLTGGSSKLRNIDKFLLYNLEGVQKVVPLNIIKAVRGWGETGVMKQELMMEQAIPHLAVAFGLCLGSGGKINLLPAKEKLEQKAILLSTALRIGFPLILLLSLVFYGLNYGNALKYKILINNLESEINRLELSASQIREYALMKGKLEQRKQLLVMAKGKQPYWWGLLKELSHITPAEAIIQKITTVPGKVPQELRIAGKIFAKYSLVDLELSQFVLVLSDSPYFSHVEMVSSKNDMYSPIPAADFEIVCQLNY
ncbi:MAG: pilus assembly protein PilM [Candidatus Omnitrophica bacterium]|nr:pilus assembly protein PilM [Candidatus Omnitrophota bacterium]